jgi:two-component system, NarL family, response regulator DesR
VVRIQLAMPGGLLRGALRFVLSSQPDIEVIAEHDTVGAAIRAARDDIPDVTVLDLELLCDGYGVDALHAARETHAELPDSKVLVLVDPRRPGFGSRLAAVPPAIGFLAQTARPERVVDAVRQLARGEPVIDGDLLLAALTRKPALSQKELRVLEVAALGAPVKEIAQKLGLSPGTVRNHLSRILAKTGARNRIEAIHIAQESGWI